MRDKRGWRSLWVAVLISLGAFACWPAVADASARVLTPRGWGENASAAPEAQRRAGRWQSALGMPLEQVVSAPEDGRFAETIAVFDAHTAIAEPTFADEALAIETLATVVVDVVGTEAPVEAGMRHTDSGERYVWARWIVDDLDYECVLAPAGDSSTVIVAAVLADEAELHRATLSKTFAELDGVTDPMPRFSLLAWRLGSIVLWIALALGLHAAMLPLGDRDHDHSQAGRRAVAINFILVIVGTLIASVALRGRELALVYANSSVTEMSVWVGVAGMTVVGLHFLIASRLDRGQVQSAPRSGAFASGVYSSPDILRSSVTRSGLRKAFDELEPSASGSFTRTPSDAPSAPSSTARGRIVIDDDEVDGRRR